MNSHKWFLLIFIGIALSGCGARLSDLKAGDLVDFQGDVGLRSVKVNWSRPLLSISAESVPSYEFEKTVVVLISELEKMGASSLGFGVGYRFNGTELVQVKQLDFLYVIP